MISRKYFQYNIFKNIRFYYFSSKIRSYRYGTAEYGTIDKIVWKYSGYVII